MSLSPHLPRSMGASTSGMMSMLTRAMSSAAVAPTFRQKCGESTALNTQ
jgi:hypothetical protein